MDKGSRNVFFICLISLALLLIGYHYSDYISPDNTGVHFDYEKFTRAGIAFLIAVVLMRILFVVFIRPREEKLNREMANILKYIIGIFVLILTALYIVTQIYGESASAILIGLGASGVGLVYICQDMLKDLFAGLTIAFQNDFRVGDWVKFPDGTIAKIIKTKLTGVDLRLLNNTQLYVSNQTFTNGAMINLNQPDRPFSDGIKVTIEHKVPIDSARRILERAVLTAYGMKDDSILVAAESVELNGVVFAIFYDVPDYNFMRVTRHHVIASIVKHLRRHNLKLCEIAGQYNITNIDPKTVVPIQEECVTTALDALLLSGLLASATREVQMLFASRMKRRHLRKGDCVCKQGDHGNTMFIIAEGVVDVKKEMIIDKENEKINHTEIVETLYDGDFFGEMAIIRNEKRAATIEAKTDVVLFEIDRDTIKHCLEKYPEFARQISEAIVERDLDNTTTKADVSKEYNKKESRIKMFMDAFKSFLGADE